MKRLLAYRFVAMAALGRFLLKAGGRVQGWGVELTYAVEAKALGRKTLRQIRAQDALDKMRAQRPITGGGLRAPSGEKP